MTKEYMNALNEVKQCIEWIYANHPDCMKFAPTDRELRSISVSLKYNNPDTYCSMIMIYGILFTLAVLAYMVEIEEYEKCQQIVNGIHMLNVRYNCGLPSYISDDWCKLNKSLSPHEILHTYFKTNQKCNKQ